MHSNYSLGWSGYFNDRVVWLDNEGCDLGTVGSFSTFRPTMPEMQRQLKDARTRCDPYALEAFMVEKAALEVADEYPDDVLFMPDTGWVFEKKSVADLAMARMQAALDAARKEIYGEASNEAQKAALLQLQFGLGLPGMQPV